MNPVSLTLLALASALAQLPPSPDPKPVPINGTVVDGSGAPVANADVWLAEAIAPADGRRTGSELLDPDLTKQADGTTPALAHTRADAAGRFALEVPAEAAARRSPTPMAIWAAVTGKDARVARHRLPRIVLADDPPLRIELAPPAARRDHRPRARSEAGRRRPRHPHPRRRGPGPRAAGPLHRRDDRRQRPGPDRRL